MKKLLACALAALMLLIPACKKADNGSVETAAPQQNGASSETVKITELRFGEVTVSGKNKGFTVNGLRMNGNQVGGEGDPESVKNDKPFLMSGVRCVFELNEWISFSLSYSYDGGAAKLGVWIFPHRGLGEYGSLDDMGGSTYFAEYELPYETYPEPLEDEFCISPDYTKPGEYDLLFTLDGVIIGGMELRLTEQDGLKGLSESDIKAMITLK